MPLRPQNLDKYMFKKTFIHIQLYHKSIIKKVNVELSLNSKVELKSLVKQVEKS